MVSESKNIAKVSFAEQLAQRTKPFFDQIVTDSLRSFQEQFDVIFTSLSEKFTETVISLESAASELDKHYLDKVGYDEDISLIKDSVIREESKLGESPSSGKITVLQKLSELDSNNKKLLTDVDYLKDTYDSESTSLDSSFKEEVDRVKEDKRENDKKLNSRLVSIERSVKNLSAPKIVKWFKLGLIGALSWMFKDAIIPIVSSVYDNIISSDGAIKIKGWLKDNFPKFYDGLQVITDFVSKSWSTVVKIITDYQTRALQENLDIPKTQLGRTIDIDSKSKLIVDSTGRALTGSKKHEFDTAELEAMNSFKAPWKIPHTDVKVHLSPDKFQEITGRKFTDEDMLAIASDQFKALSDVGFSDKASSTVNVDDWSAAYAKGIEPRLFYEEKLSALKSPKQLSTVLVGIDSSNFDSRVVSVDSNQLPFAINTDTGVQSVKENTMAGVALASQGVVSPDSSMVQIGQTPSGVVVIREKDRQVLMRYVQNNTTH